MIVQVATLGGKTETCMTLTRRPLPYPLPYPLPSATPLLGRLERTYLRHSGRKSSKGNDNNNGARRSVRTARDHCTFKPRLCA